MPSLTPVQSIALSWLADGGVLILFVLPTGKIKSVIAGPLKDHMMRVHPNTLEWLLKSGYVHIGYNQGQYYKINAQGLAALGERVVVVRGKPK